jgi:hypothetical protein
MFCHAVSMFRRAADIFCRAAAMFSRAAAMFWRAAEVRKRAVSAVNYSGCTGKRALSVYLQAGGALWRVGFGLAIIFAILSGVYYFPALPMSASARLVAARSASGLTGVQ